MAFFLVTTKNATRTFIVEAGDRRAAASAACVMMTEEEDVGVHYVELTPVKDEETAHAHFAALTDDLDCRDNARNAYQTDAAAMRDYNDAADSGCCGSIDKAYLVGGFNAYWIGCNYGH